MIDPTQSFYTSSIIRLGELQKLIGLSSCTIWRLERQGRFPARLKIGKRAVGWLFSDVRSWINDRKTSASKPQRKTGGDRG